MRRERAIPYSYTEENIPSFTPLQQKAYRKTIMNFYQRDIIQNWKEVLKETLLYKKPHLIYGANTRADFYKQLFVHFMMLKSGKHEFVIRTPAHSWNSEEYYINPEPDAEVHYSYFSNVVDIRVEDVHPCKYPSAINFQSLNIPYLSFSR